jgi:DegV family protein with EDD domain
VIGFCTDSNAQFPPELAARYGVEIVPLTVTVDGVDYAEGVDLDADAFYAKFAAGKPDVATAAPSPGAFAQAYEALAHHGATEILSVHIGSAISGTFNSARLAAQASSVPVRLVDTGQASFVIACALWEAAEAVAGGAGLEDAAAVAERVASRCQNVFVVGGLDLARAGGRLAPGVDDPAARGDGPDGVAVLSLVDGAITAVGSVRGLDEAAEAMAGYITASGSGLRVGVGIADAAAAPLWQQLENRLAASPQVKDVARYRIGPSVGAHTGPGTAGAVWYPSEL